MRVIRRHLSWLVGAWLACQAVALAAAPITLCGSQPAEEHQDGVCCPGIEPGQVCPMHHVREDVRTCAIGSPCSASDAALLSLLGALGLTPVARVVLDVAPIAAPVSTLVDAVMTRSELPESPPPRQ